MTLEILHRARGWVAVAKPAGALVIPGRGEQEGPSLREMLEEQLGQKVWVVHRLDRDTSGALAFALDAVAHRSLSMAFEGGRIQKTYLALVDGMMPEPLDISVPIAPARKGKMRPARAQERDGKPARTLVRPLEQFGGRTLVEVEPLTGRTHQIRVHLAWAGHPLLVDPQYGRKQPVAAKDLGGQGDEPVLERTPLHASKLVVPALEGVEPASVTAPLSEDMDRALRLLRGTA